MIDVVTEFIHDGVMNSFRFQTPPVVNMPFSFPLGENFVPKLSTFLEDQNRLLVIIGILFFLIFLILLSLYLWHVLGDIIVILKNYNFPRAKKCHWSSCGLYFHEESDPQTKGCLSPLVSDSFFKKRSKGGNQPGCRHSIQVREHDTPRKPAKDYLEEFMKMRSGFNVYKEWWGIIVIVACIFLWILSIISLYDFIRILS